MSRITFDEVSLRAAKTVKCSGCGKRLTRSRKFYQTINPFNKREDGLIKSRNDIYSELIEAANKWKKESEVCNSCISKAAEWEGVRQ
jgi:hypothetical protein